MEHKLLAYFSSISPLSEEEAAAIAETIVTRPYKKGDVLLREGDISNEVYFVLEGCVRQYYLVDGEEKTVNFFTEGQWVISMKSLGEQKPSAHYIACTTDVSLVVGNQSKESELFRRFPRFEMISRRMMEMLFAEQHEQAASYLVDTPEQRYLKLMKTRPELLQIVPQYQLASYIGVQPESLSRIRKRLAQKPGG